MYVFYKEFPTQIKIHLKSHLLETAFLAFFSSLKLYKSYETLFYVLNCTYSLMASYIHHMQKNKMAEGAIMSKLYHILLFLGRFWQPSWIFPFKMTLMD